MAEAEGFVLPMKPGNSGGGKGPQFKTDAGRSEGHGDWETINSKDVQNLSSPLQYHVTRDT
jgi:hypothetical protein